MSEQLWYTLRNGAQSGPFSPSELKKMAACGELQPDDFLWRDGLSEWILAGSIPKLFKPRSADPPLSTSEAAGRRDVAPQSSPPPLQQSSMGAVRMLRVACPHCKSVLDAPDTVSGQEVDCPICQRPFCLPRIVSDTTPVLTASRPIATADADGRGASSPNSKPLGIILTAIYSAINAVLTLFASFVVFLAASFIPMYGVLGALLLIVAVLYMANCYGLWTVQKWARMLTFVVYGLGIAGGLIDVFVHRSLGNVILQLVQMAINAAVLVYFANPTVKLLFLGARSRSRCDGNQTALSNSLPALNPPLVESPRLRLLRWPKSRRSLLICGTAAITVAIAFLCALFYAFRTPTMAFLQPAAALRPNDIDETRRWAAIKATEWYDLVESSSTEMAKERATIDFRRKEIEPYIGKQVTWRFQVTQVGEDFGKRKQAFLNTGWAEDHLSICWHPSFGLFTNRESIELDQSLADHFPRHDYLRIRGEIRLINMSGPNLITGAREPYMTIVLDKVVAVDSE